MLDAESLCGWSELCASEQTAGLHPPECVGEGVGLKAVRYRREDQTQERKNLGMLVHLRGVSVQRNNWNVLENKLLFLFQSSQKSKTTFPSLHFKSHLFCFFPRKKKTNVKFISMW